MPCLFGETWKYWNSRTADRSACLDLISAYTMEARAQQGESHTCSEVIVITKHNSVCVSVTSLSQHAQMSFFNKYPANPTPDTALSLNHLILQTGIFSTCSRNQMQIKDSVLSQANLQCL